MEIINNVWVIGLVIAIVGLAIYYSGVTRKVFPEKHFEELSEGEERFFSMIWPLTTVLMVVFYLTLALKSIFDGLKKMRL